MKYISSNKVRMHDTDMAGILYFARQYRFAHDSWEDLMAEEGLTFTDLMQKKPFITVIVHSEADYMVSLRSGDRVEVKTWVDHIGSTSFSITYEIYNVGSDSGDVFDTPVLSGRCKTVHVCVGKDSREKISIPDELMGILTKYQA
ncbi:acyl-CoA thioesterase [bacterium]|jgi:1,4-dihydroxy-2-naphthoyl-CoA hydrolase|nr:acyl-CoA thioesterase [bacterium]